MRSRCIYIYTYIYIFMYVYMGRWIDSKMGKVVGLGLPPVAR